MPEATDASSTGVLALFMERLAAVGLTDPEVLIQLSRASGPAGLTAAGGLFAWKELDGSRIAVIDDAGAVSFRDLATRVKAIAAALARRGVGPGGNVAVLCRNHRHLIEAAIAIPLTGAHAVMLNTGFAGPQVLDVLEREGVEILILDEEFTGPLDLSARPHFLAHREGSGAGPCLEDLANECPSGWSPSATPGRQVILTSGTTGTPKGARHRARSPAPAEAGPVDGPPRTGASSTGIALLDMLGRIGMRTGQRTFVASPIFHAWGAGFAFANCVLGGTLVISAHFGAEATLAAVAQHGPRALVVVPVMLQRILALESKVRKRYDTSSLRSVASSGSALPAPLALRWMDAFGDNLYNVYGSTETGLVSIAGPADLRNAPGTAGHPPLRTQIRILGPAGEDLPPGQLGRIFAANDMLFDSYTDGGRKECVDGFMSTGDMGYLDAEGRLFVQGRDDDMIVSGGENVFPIEIESLLAGHPEIQEAAVIGAPDETFGQRLRAFVVPVESHSLTPEAVREYVRDQLARYKIPREVVFLEELPRNATGKVLRRRLSDYVP